MSAVTIIFPINYTRTIRQLTNQENYFGRRMAFFRQYNFHKQKLVLHRASMKNFEYQLKLKK